MGMRRCVLPPPPPPPPFFSQVDHVARIMLHLASSRPLAAAAAAATAGVTSCHRLLPAPHPGSSSAATCPARPARCCRFDNLRALIRLMAHSRLPSVCAHISPYWITTDRSVVQPTKKHLQWTPVQVAYRVFNRDQSVRDSQFIFILHACDFIF